MSWGETLFLKKAIDGKKTFRASENQLVIFRDNPYTYSAGDTIGKFISKTNGQINLLVFVRSYAGSGGINVKENDVYIGYLSIPNTSTESVLTLSINVKKGKQYQFDVATSFTANKIYIGADIVDGSLFDYTIGG